MSEYCEKCGTELEIFLEPTKKFDTNTGRPTFWKLLKCPLWGLRFKYFDNGHEKHYEEKNITYQNELFS